MKLFLTLFTYFALMIGGTAVAGGLPIIGGGGHLLGSLPTLTLTPANGALWGTPGTTVGWGFTLTNNTSYTLYQTNVYADGSLYGSGGTTALGVFRDEIAIWSDGQGISLAPGAHYTGSFEGGNGIASFAISTLATWGIPAEGLIKMDYELYDNSDPDNPIFQDTGTLIAEYLGQPVTASVNIPEPSTLSLVSLALIFLGMMRRSWSS